MTIGERLRFLRLRNNLTQEELGKQIGVKKQTIEKYEKGLIKNIPETKRKQIVQILGCIKMQSNVVRNVVKKMDDTSLKLVPSVCVWR